MTLGFDARVRACPRVWVLSVVARADACVDGCTDARVDATYVSRRPRARCWLARSSDNITGKRDSIYHHKLEAMQFLRLQMCQN